MADVSGILTRRPQSATALLAAGVGRPAVRSVGAINGRPRTVVGKKPGATIRLQRLDHRLAGSAPCVDTRKNPHTWTSRGLRGPKKLRRRWRQEAWPLLLVLIFTTLFADLIILLTSPFLGAEALAPFGVVLKISMLIGFIVQVTHQISLPELADAHQREDTEGVLDALLRSTCCRFW